MQITSFIKATQQFWTFKQKPCFYDSPVRKKGNLKMEKVKGRMENPIFAAIFYSALLHNYEFHIYSYNWEKTRPEST